MTNWLHHAWQLVRTSLASLLTLLVLAGIGYWGYLTEWKLPGFSSGGQQVGEEPEAKQEDKRTSAQVIRPASVDKSCPLDRTRIAFTSAEAVRAAGIEYGAAEQEPVRETISVPAEVNYDPTRVTRLSSPVSGRLWRVEGEVGQRVDKGAVLGLVDSADVGKAKANFLEALTQVGLNATTASRLREAGGAVAGRQVREAEAALRDARIRLFNAEQSLINLGLPIRGKDVEALPDAELTARLRYLGLSGPVVKELDPEIATSNLLPIRTPFAGMVVERQASPSEVVDPSKVLFVVADLSQIWIVLSVRQEDMDRLALKQPIVFVPDGFPEESIRGELSWISTMVDDKTRTIQVRAVVANPGDHYRSGMFGTAQIITRDAPNAVVVPKEATQREGECRFVFVRLDDQAFEVRKVRLGVSSGPMIEIQQGLRPGEVVVTRGSFFLKSELLKGRLGEAD